MKLQKLKEMLVGTDEVNQNKNETVFAEVIQFHDERSLSRVIREAKDDGREQSKYYMNSMQGVASHEGLHCTTTLHH